jgi:hypothetical protein
MAFCVDNASCQWCILMGGYYGSAMRIATESMRTVEGQSNAEHFWLWGENAERYVKARWKWKNT